MEEIQPQEFSNPHNYSIIWLEISAFQKFILKKEKGWSPSIVFWKKKDALKYINVCILL